MTMNETEKKIADIVSGIDLERKKPVLPEEKQQTAELLDELTAAKRQLDKLHLKLWYAVEKKDYHSLSLEQAKQELRSLLDALEKLI